MFRRVTSLPARPPIPCKEEILEDLSNALSDDVIYQHSKENVKNDTNVMQSLNNIKEYEDFDFEVKIPVSSYLKVDSFLDKINCLKISLMNLEEQKLNMKKLEENLIQEMSRIKKELHTKTEEKQ